MDRLFGQLFSDVVGYMNYAEENNYMMTRWGCRKTTNELCRQLRSYRQEILPNPRIEDMVRYYFRPCEESCPYYIAYDNAVPLVIYSIREYGKILTCKSLYGIELYYITEGRYPSEFELLLFEQLMNLPIQELVPEERKPVRVDSYLLTKTIPDQVCCICQEDIVMNQRVVTLPCLHTFHSKKHDGKIECLGIESWLERSDECPLCKKSVRE